MMQFPTFTKFFKPIKPKRRLAMFQACIIGLVSGASAFLLTEGIDFIGSMRVHFSFLYGTVTVLPLIGLLGGLIAGFLTEHLAPETTGSGIPQIKATLGGVKIAANLRVALVKLVGGTIAIGSGLRLGREGPTVQIGACLGGELSRLVPTTPQQRRQLLSAGAAAGLAAAFHAPIAGVLFVVEELLRDLSSLTLGTAVLACFVASVVSQALGAHALEFNLRQANLVTDFSVFEIPAFAVLGLAAGLLGSLFNKAIITSLNINRALRLSLTMRVALAGLATGVFLAYMPNYFQNNAELREMIIKGNVDGNGAMLAFGSQLFLTALAYGSGSPGGIFSPALMLGASLGYLVGYYTHFLFNLGLPTTYALVGMGAFFAAVARVPMTAIVIVLEMTNNLNIAMPLMICTIVAFLVAEQMSAESIYDRLMEWAGISPIDPHELTKTLLEIKAADMMVSPVQTVDANSSLDNIRTLFLNSPLHGFPVCEKESLVGIVTKTDLSNPAHLSLSGQTKVSEIMTPNPVTAAPTDTLKEVIRLFEFNSLHDLPVVESGKVLGIITHSDIIRAQAKYL